MSTRTFLIGAARERPCTVVVCRGCCCGNRSKHPGTDHAWQLDRLRAAGAEHGFQVRTTDCLGPCDQANVLVVQPSAAGRRAGGGPGLADPPTTLELQFIRPPRDARVRSRR